MWYYLENGQQRGPVDDAALDGLANTGVVSPQTLVWRQGQAEWQPLQVVRAGTPASARATCSVCGKSFPSDEVIELLGRPVCAACKPALAQSLREGVVAPSAGGSVWADGKKVVTFDQTTLPARCFKCNEPVSSAPIKRKVAWHHPAIFLTIFLGLLIYVIIAILASRRAKVEVYLCDKHRSKRRNYTIAGWSGVVLSVFLVIYGGSQNNGIASLLGIFLFFGAAIAGLRGASLCRASMIKDKTIWLTGAGKEFLASLPGWAGGKP